ncbi:MAG: division/cell wall cluster transcriptional repressor MraZ [Cellulomonadaceae bacterium]|jgi:MraZ protein|nr:division/cell wall cluster transcriptional repressor MraZ [Cellulomonadaceae bacterium]
MGETLLSGGLLLGTYTPKLDEKGRLILPSKFRPRLASGLVLTRGQERCLLMLPMDEFSRMYEQIQKAPSTDRRTRDYLRVFLAGASDDTPDKQGRIVIPPHLREYAGLDRDVAVIGLGTRVELWDSTTWTTYLANQEEAYSETEDPVLPSLGF